MSGALVLVWLTVMTIPLWIVSIAFAVDVWKGRK